MRYDGDISYVSANADNANIFGIRQRADYATVTPFGDRCEQNAAGY